MSVHTKYILCFASLVRYEKRMLKERVTTSHKSRGSHLIGMLLNFQVLLSTVLCKQKLVIGSLVSRVIRLISNRHFQTTFPIRLMHTLVLIQVFERLNPNDSRADQKKKTLLKREKQCFVLKNDVYLTKYTYVCFLFFCLKENSSESERWLI